MRAEIISIGDEMTSGQRLDTNSQWLSQKLSDLGVQTFFHTTVGDDLEANIDVFRAAARRAEIVVCSGGLGPTADDLTREAFSQAFERPLELRQEALDHIEALFASRKRSMPERNRVQAFFPIGSKIISNPHGSAPGIDLAVNTFRTDGSIQACRFFALPGVPAEMQQMWMESVQNRLRDELGIGKKRWFYHEMKVFGIGESDCEALVPDLIKRDRIPRVGITVHRATITLRIALLASSEQEAATMAEPTKKEIREALGDLIFGEGDQELHEAVFKNLVAVGERLSVIEFGSAAMIAPKLAELVDDDSDEGLVAAKWFPNEYLLTAKADKSKSDWRANALIQSAVEYRQETKSDWCLVVGPYPSQIAIHSKDNSSTTKMPTCDFTITLVGPGDYAKSHTIQLGGHPDIIHSRLGNTGLDYLRKRMLEREGCNQGD